jgi:hypothetical protein
MAGTSSEAKLRRLVPAMMVCSEGARARSSLWHRPHKQKARREAGLLPSLNVFAVTQPAVLRDQNLYASPSRMSSSFT